MTDRTVRERADELRRAGRHAEVVELCGPTWDDPTTRDLDFGWTLAFSLRKTGDHARSLEVARDLWRAGRRDQWVAGEYARAIYNTVIKGAEVYDETLRKAVLAIRDLLVDDAGDPRYSPLPTAALAVAKLSKDQPTRVLELLAVLEPSKLSREPGRGEDADGRTRSFPSDLERYWMAKTRALKGTGRWQELLTALEQIPADAISPEGQGWLAQREATAHRQLGAPRRALEQLQARIGSSREWWLQLEMAECHVALGDQDAAFPDVVAALALPGPAVAHRIRAVELMATLAAARGDAELARDHVALAIAIRTEEGWPLRQELLEVADDTGGAPTEAASRDLVRRLRNRWQQLRDEADPPLTGTVGRLLLGDDGVAHSGFIRGDDGEECFFRVSDVIGSPVATGAAVSYRRQPSFDRKKNRESWRATGVRQAG